MTDARMQLHTATLADAQVISGWVASAEELLVCAGPRLSFPLEPQALLATSRDGWNVRCLEVDGHLVGTGSFTLRDGAVHLGRLLVDPRRRGAGLGRVLVTALLAHARLHSPELARATRATLNVFADNQPARGLYESLGFTVVEETVHDGRGALAMIKAIRPDIEQLAVMAPQVMARHRLVQWLLEPGDDDRALRLHLRVPGDPRRVALLEVLPTASVFLGRVAGARVTPDFAERGDEEVEEVFTDCVNQLCALLLGPTMVHHVWRGDRLHATRVVGNSEEAGDHGAGELFGLRRRVLTRFGVQFEETELHFPADVEATVWRPGDPGGRYPLEAPDEWWREASRGTS
ncbi:MULTISPECIES: GNAT family N-acetyltransferase [unclassified Luteococcus]|uniref:GNAT family N-acetyltransferase n=1 Tax=unclassified Luteococcus TaxID=2639923 RepID=UPI00313D1678